MAFHALIVADAARARFFTADEQLEQMVETLDLIHPEGQLPERELYSDGMGRDRGTTLEPRTERRDREDEVFARRVVKAAVERIDDGERWIVVAPPTFLGALRRVFPDRFDKRLVATIAKDLSKEPVHELPDAIRRHLPPTAGMP